MKKATIHDIAKELNTTAATVSRALNNHPRISDNTKKLVLDMAKKLGYEPNAVASALRKGRSNMVGIIVPFTDRSFFASVIRGVEEVVRKEGFNVMICQSHEKAKDEAANIDSLLTAQVSGVMISFAKEQSSFNHLKKVLDKDIPLILFDRTTDAIGSYSVAIDDFQGAYMATDHLIRAGYKKIAAFIGIQHLNIYKDRYRGYKAALEENGFDFNPDYVVEIESEIGQGKIAAEKLMSLEDRPDAIFSSSDFSALGALQYLKENDIKVPGEVGLIGFANEPFTQYLDPPLSTIDQKSRTMGEMMARVFLDQVNNKKEVEPQKILLKPELIVRKSSLKIPVVL